MACKCSIGVDANLVAGDMIERCRNAGLDGLIEMTRPDKPRSSLQKYRLTEKGRTWFAERKR